MSSVCGKLDFKDTESHLERSSSSSSDHISCIGSEDAQESDGDDSSGYTHTNADEEGSIDITKAIPPQCLHLDSLDGDEGEDESLATALQDMFSECQPKSVVVTLIPAIKGSREKHGKSLEKLSVKWAEDVYDPTPSIVSHTKNKKQQQPKAKSRDNLKKNGKKGQKGKDKKQSSSSRSKHNRDKFGWDTQVPIVAASS